MEKLLFIFFTFLTLSAFSQIDNKVTLKSDNLNQLKFGERFIYSTSFTYILNTGYYRENKYHEFTWGNSISVNLNKSIYIGLQYLLIHTKGSIIYKDNPSEDYFMYGFKIQYDFLPNYENRLFIETSFNKGNYCTCGDTDPYKKENLIYWGLGFGYDYPIYKRLSITTGFNVYIPINKIKEKYTYNIYIIGLNLNLGKTFDKSKTRIPNLFE